MSKSSPELSPFENDLSDFHEPNEPELPRIKLKLRLNPSNVKAEEDRKKKKHKKKRSHRKHRHKKQDEDDGTLDTSNQTRKHRSRRESEQLNIDEDDEEEDESTPYHVPVGGKRPFALLQAEEQQEQENEEDQQTDLSTHHKKRPRYGEVPIKEEPYDAGYEEENEDVDDNLYRTSHSSKDVSDYPQSYHPTDASQIQEAVDYRNKKRARPIKGAVVAPLPTRTAELPKKNLIEVCQKLLETLEKRDAYGFFLEPVDTKIVRDYLTVIKSPMDFSTMRRKLESGQYHHMEQFRDDFLLIMTNAKTYNAPDTIYWKSADKLQRYGVKAIERAEKTVGYDVAPALEIKQGKKRQDSISRKLSNVSVSSIKKDPLVKVEEEVDILGLDSLPPRKPGRQGSESTVARETSVDTNILPRDSKKKKKKKVTEAGVIYAPDGSLNAVGGVPNLTSLLPQEKPFADLPLITTVNRQALPSAFYLNRPTTYDDMSLNKHLVHAACFANYGPFTTLGTDYPCKFYTAQDAYYVYPLYADDCGEAYMKSIWDFVDGLGLEEKTEAKARYLTHGAWDVMKEVLKNEDREKIDTEFGVVDVPVIVEALEVKEKEAKAL
ncbi:hypothetical protein EC973_002303 [Apophysomyces ossiformis]|uniref:Bromo domain-containing protein n=1 Tax=Apophysomyces ossiformis TaxID=679940 RepID=A0A8H7ELT8_9FUNG|nr:hypothetical protein EC973_002303 [Apophysomyces ossiformis]